MDSVFYHPKNRNSHCFPLIFTKKEWTVEDGSGSGNFKHTDGSDALVERQAVMNFDLYLLVSKYYLFIYLFILFMNTFLNFMIKNLNFYHDLQRICIAGHVLL